MANTTETNSTFFPPHQLDVLHSLRSAKRRVAIVIKWKYPFFTRLENFRKPGDTGMIGIFPEQVRPNIIPTGGELGKFFDLILWYRADWSMLLDAQVDADLLDIGEVREAVTAIAEVFGEEGDRNKLVLIEMEEYTLHMVCQLREELGIPADIEHLRNKAMLKTLIHQSGIPTTPFAVIDFSLIRTVQQARDKAIEAYSQLTGGELGASKLFYKPVCGVAGGGNGQLKSLDELENWIVEAVRRREMGTCLVEKFVSGREFWAIVCLLPGEARNWQPLYVVDFELGDRLRRGAPITFFAHRFECAEELGLFPGITNFVGRCVEVLKPPHPHVFCVQGFQTEPNSDRYLFTECGYRLNGPRGTGIGYGAAGVSLETALFSTHLDPTYRAEQDPAHKQHPMWEAQIWWPWRSGLLRSQETLIAVPLASKVEFTWYVQAGTVMTQAKTFAHFLVSARVQNFASEEQLRQDVKWVEENWSPDVGKGDENSNDGANGGNLVGRCEVEKTHSSITTSQCPHDSGLSRNKG